MQAGTPMGFLRRRFGPVASDIGENRVTDAGTSKGCSRGQESSAPPDSGSWAVLRMSAANAKRPCLRFTLSHAATILAEMAIAGLGLWAAYWTPTKPSWRDFALSALTLLTGIALGSAAGALASRNSTLLWRICMRRSKPIQFLYPLRRRIRRRV